jgi:hypothetical protein
MMMSVESIRLSTTAEAASCGAETAVPSDRRTALGLSGERVWGSVALEVRAEQAFPALFPTGIGRFCAEAFGAKL